MGTNFYQTKTKKHIGKRSAAGLYCRDCSQTLRVGGEKYVHYSHEPSIGYQETPHNQGWYTECPKCGGTREKDENSSGFIELGFSKPKQSKTSGVKTCSSFSWAQQPEDVKAWCNKYKNRKVVVDEYGAKYTGKEFLDMLTFNCPIQFTKLIGVEFC